MRDSNVTAKRTTVGFGALAGAGVGIVAHDLFVIRVEEPQGVVTVHKDHVHGYVLGGALIVVGLIGAALTW